MDKREQKEQGDSFEQAYLEARAAWLPRDEDACSAARPPLPPAPLREQPGPGVTRVMRVTSVTEAPGH